MPCSLLCPTTAPCVLHFPPCPTTASVPRSASLSRQAGSYCVYAALNAIVGLFLAKRMVETKQQPVERIRALLMGEDS